MSDSDSDSDDDLLLGGGPIFNRKRPNRKQSATNTKRVNLLNSLIDEQDERICRQARINETLQKQKEGFVPDEKDLIDSLDNHALASSGREDGIGTDEFGSASKNDGNKIKDEHTPLLDTCTKKVAYDIEDPSYWSKINAMQETGKTALHERRQKIENEINGFDMKSEFRGPQDSEDRERMMAEISGRHSDLGTRRVLGWFHKSGSNSKIDNSLAPFASLENAMKDLLAIFHKYDRAPKRGLGTHGCKQWNGIRNIIIKPLKEAKSLKILPQMLGRHWKPDLDIPEDLFFWLVRVATTGMMRMGTELCLGAFTMAITIFNSTMCILRFEGGEPKDVPKVLDFSDFVPMLETNFGLGKIKNNSLTLVQSCSEIQNIKFEEPSGLDHAFKIWTAAITNGKAKFPSHIDDDQTIISHGIAKILCCGLDPIFYSGHDLLACQGKLLFSLLERAYHKYKHECISNDNEKEVSQNFDEWTMSTSQLVLKFCREQFSKLPIVDDADTDDDEGFLSMELVIRSWHTIEKAESVDTFYFGLCNLALQKCVGDTCDWDAEVHRSGLTMIKLLNKNENDEEKLEEGLHLRYRALATAETALGMLTKENFEKNGPRFLGTIRIAAISEQVGIELFMSNIKKTLKISRNRGFCESDAEAAMLYEHLNHLCNLCQHIKKSIRAVVNPHMLRAKELALLLYTVYDKCKLKVSMWDKGRKSEKRRQSSLSSFLETREEDEDDQSTR